MRRSCRSDRPCRRARPRPSRARSRGRPPAARRVRSARPAAPTRRACAATPRHAGPRARSSGASPSDGSSSINRRGRAISARPMASIWRSPPDSVAASCARRSCRRGKIPNTSCMRGFWSRWPRRQRAKPPSSRLSSTDISPNSSRFSGTRPTPRATIASTGPGDALASKLERAPRRQQAHRSAQQRGLAGAVGADHGDDLAFVDLEVDLVYGLDGP